MGRVARMEASFIVLDVGGVGYKVSVPVSVLTAFATGDTAYLHVHTHVREDEIALYGFLAADDQQIFELLLGVSGIGPKVALSILSAMDSGSLVHAVTTNDTRTLVRIPGLGMKTAQRLTLELGDKLAMVALLRKSGRPADDLRGTQGDDLVDDVVEGLVSLGYNRNDSRKAAERAINESAGQRSMGEHLKAALNVLTGAQAR
jgi:Holliday junction DNA helicase RuvA